MKNIDVFKRLSRWRKVSPIGEGKWLSCFASIDLLLSCGCAFVGLYFFLFPMVIFDMKHHAWRSHNGFLDVFNAVIILLLVCNVSRSRTTYLNTMTNDVKDNCSNQPPIFTKGSHSKVVYKKVGKEDENDVSKDSMLL